jgi:L-lactate utilization protein LutC
MRTSIAALFGYIEGRGEVVVEQMMPRDHQLFLMVEAYRRVRLNETAYGCFMMGPSATADVEATLVHGAQGARSLNVFFLRPV